MIQRIVRIGNSAVAIIPKKVLVQLGLQVGDEVSVKFDKQRERILVKPAPRES